ncbi:endopeptidase La [Exilibacterium tricleocarpae]|uniref:Lon protease n=1 Tax=Exilibacterium tricleocarpae TaxID=2591008 RepID=A0A545TVH2_9GAMM|nr:endopeptidase La [Exilibacterium tricleocarpae]TQV81161.1 endopeptidase La [Exilibacterium tricleocarpae]
MTDYPSGNLPILPVKNSVLFPFISMPLVINRPASVAALDVALASEDKFIALFTQKDPQVSEPTLTDLYDIGTLGVIKKMARLDRFLHVEVLGVTRIKRAGRAGQMPYLNDSFEYLPEPRKADGSAENEALYRAVLELIGKMLNLIKPEMQTGLNMILSEIDNPLKQIYLLTMILPIDTKKEMALLSAATEVELFTLMHEHLEHEVRVLELRDQINREVESKIGKEQREYFLRQQMRTIQEELGEERPEQADVGELRRRAADAELPAAVDRVLQKELKRLERMSPVAPDYQLTRTYVELVLELPWQRRTDDLLDLERAQRILDDDHFGLTEIKERIVEHLAVMKLNPASKAPILCFVGPPGVGKTSVGQSIARAMGRRFERMSLGGLHDEAELRGHRRTYIGAMPGRILQAVRRAGVRNPLLMLDEVDKLGRDFRGDPAAALMEILDPAQNTEFHDNYLDMPFDLSGVFFIVTANTLQNIPAPLLDRMEVLRLAGYSDEEKLEIARRYLIPRRLEQAGLQARQLQLPDATLRHIIRRYTREAGVRELERVLGRLARKLAARIVKGGGGELCVAVADLAELLGPEMFHTESLRQYPAVGVAAGLAWTEAGGEVLYVETARLAEGKELMLTGQLGDVMQESAKTARSYIWSHAEGLGIDRKRILDAGVHIHVPSGAVPKDGPSAGVTMVTALASLYTGVVVRNDTAMTGEITLSGLVLPVGGIKEKVLAAHRAGIFRVILPAENEKDLAELPEQVRNKMAFIYVSRIEALLDAAIPELTSRPASVGQGSV